MKIFTNVLFTGLLIIFGLLAQESRAQSIIDSRDSVYTYDTTKPKGSPNNPNLPPVNTIGKWIRTVRLNWNTNMWKAYVYTGSNGVGVPFRLLFPKTYDPTANDGKKYPMMVFFHGVGEAGPVTDNEYSMANGGPVFTNANQKGYDAFVLIMQSTGSWGANHNTYITNIINYMVANGNKLDPFRVVVNGLSAGGYNSWNFMETYPQYTAASLPMSGVALQDANYIQTYKYTPVWLFQGGLDGSPDPGTASNVVGQINNAGGNIKYTLYPTLGHGTWNTAWSDPDFFAFCMRVYSANPWTLFGRTQFCPGDPVNVTLGVAPGYDAYQWRKDGVVISGATTNSINATALGTYDCRVQRLGIWSDWSRTPVVLSIKPPTVTPPIRISGLMSDAIPAADGNNYVNLEVPDSGYTSYTWKKVGSDSVIGNTRIFKATQPGQYIVSVTQQYGCSSIYSPPFRVIDAKGPNPPSAASNLVANALSFTQIDLNWARNPNPTFKEAAFEIYRGTAAGGPYTYIGQARADSVHYTDQGLKPNVKYYYVVRAIDSTAAAPLSNESFAITQSDQTPPAAPLNLSVTGTTPTSVSLSWNKATDNVGVTGYYIYVNGVKSYFTTDTFYTVKALATAQQFSFSIVAMDGSGNASPQSNQVTAATIQTGLNYKYYTTTATWTVLPNFSTLTPTSTGMMPNVSIAGATQTQKFGYVWYGYIRIPVSGTYTFATTSDDGSALWFNATSASGTPLVNNDSSHATRTRTGTIALQAGTYPIFVEYFQGTGGEAMSLSWASTSLFGDNTLRPIDNSYFVTPYTPADVAPVLPTNVTAVATSYNKVKVQWTDRSNNETGFEIYRSTAFNGPYSIVATLPAGKTSYNDSTVQASTKYFYRVQAINSYGSSGFDSASVGGIKYTYYQNAGGWTNLSQLNSQPPVSTGFLANVSTSPTTRTTNYAFKFQGMIKIATTGTYTFYTNSDDGSDLYIGGYDSAHLVVQNDFVQAATTRSGTVTLNAGTYPFYVTYFQGTGGAALSVSWKGPGFNQVAIPDSVFANNQAVTTTFPLPAVPLAPYGVTTNVLSATAIKLTWQDTASTVTGFQLYRSVADSTHFIQLASFAANVFSYTDSGLFSNQSYYYKLRATGVGGNSAYSPTVKATTLNIPPVITKQADTSMRYGTTMTLTLKATSPSVGTLTFSAANLPAFATFTDNHDRTATLVLTPATADQGNYPGLKIVVSDAFGGKDSTVFALNVNNNYAPVIDSIGNYTLSENDTLNIPLSAHEQDPSHALSFSVSNLPNNYTIVAGGNGQATLKLHPSYAAAGTYNVQVTVNDANGLKAVRTFTLTVLDKDPTRKIYVRMQANHTIGGVWNSVTGVTSTNFKDASGVNTGMGLSLPSNWWPATYSGGPTTGNNSGVYPDAVLQDYYFFAYYGGPDTVNAVITGMDTTRLYNLTFFASSVWSGAADNGSTNYRVGNQSVTLAVQNNTKNTVTISSLKPASNGTITFTMKRANASTPVGYLNALVITQLFDDSTAPAPARQLQAQYVPGTGVKLTWVDAAYNETAYQIFRSTSAGGSYSQIGTVGSGVTAYTDSTVSGGATYYYKVRASNGYGVSAFTDSVSVTTTDRVPKVNAIADVTTSSGQTVIVNVTAVDDATDHLTLTASGLPSFATFVDNGNGTGKVTIQPGAGVNGLYSGITITATDMSDSSGSASFNIYVVEQNVSSTYINFTDTTLAPRPWTNMSGIPFAGTVLSNLRDDSNTPTGISITLQDGFQGNVKVGNNPNNGTTVYPASVLQSGFFSSGTGTSRLLIQGLSVSKRYNFVLFNSYNAGSKCLTNFTLNGQTLSLDAAYNSNKTVQFDGVAPDASGTVTITVQKAAGQDYAMINSLVIQAYDPTVVPLMSPSDLRVIDQTRNSISLQWQDRANNETGYEIWRAVDGSSNYSLLTTVAANTTTYKDSSLTTDRTYYYSVRAKQNSTYSSYSNAVQGYTYSSVVWIDFNGGTLSPAPPAPWNNLNTPPMLNMVWNNFKNDAGVTTNMGMVQTARWEGLYGGGVNTGNNSGLYPDNVIIESYGMFAGETSNVTLTGLDMSKTYDFTFFASATGVFDATAYYTVNGSDPVYLNANMDTKGTVTLYGVKPNADGTALVTITAYGQAQFALIGAMIVKGYTPTVNIAPTAPGTTIVSGPSRTGAAVTLGPTRDSGDNEPKAYPNPFSNSFTLKIPAENNDQVLITVTDVNGRPMHQQRQEGLYAGVNQVLVQPAQALARGVYFVRITYVNRNEQKVLKIMKN